MNAINLKKLTHNKAVVYVSYFVVSLICIASSFCLIVFRAGDAIRTPIALYVGLLTLIVAGFFVCLLWKNVSEKQQVFVIVAIPTTLFFCFFMLPTTPPDEVWHIFRTMTVFESFGSHMYVPNDCNLNLPLFSDYKYSEFCGLLMSTTDWSSTFDTIRDMSGYTSVQYIISGLFFHIGKLLGSNYWLCIYFARTGNIILFLVAGYYAIKLIPFGKTVLLVFLLNPMLVQQEASCSADAVTNICAVVFVVFLLRVYTDERPGSKDIAAMILFALLFSICKVFGYVPMCLSILILLFKIKNKKTRLLWITITILALFAMYVYVVYFFNGSFMAEARELMRNPLNLVLVMANSFAENGIYVVKSYFGAYLGSLTVGTYKLTWLLYGILQIAVLFIRDNDSSASLDKRAKIVLVVVCIIEVLAIYMTQVWWTIEVDGRSDIISGVQGRYFIPVMIVVLLCLCRCCPNKSDNGRTIQQNTAYCCQTIKEAPDTASIVVYLKSNWQVISIVVCIAIIYSSCFLSILHSFGV